MTNRAVIYTRVSSDDQVEGFSLEAQREACLKLCEDRGYQIIGIYEERGRSGKTVHRPQFQQMIRDAQAKQFDVLVVHKLDRFSRSLLDVLTWLSRLDEHGVSFVSASEQFDFTTPFGKIILAILGAFAQWYVENLAQEVRKGKRQRAKAGNYSTRLPVGYTTTQFIREILERVDLTEAQATALEDALEAAHDLPNDAAIICPITSPGVLKAFELYSTGRYSFGRLALWLNNNGYLMRSHSGFTTWTWANVRYVLENPFYTGVIVYTEKGQDTEIYEGNHPALIGQEMFDRCRQVQMERAAGRNYGRKAQHVYPLSPILYCIECGSPIVGQYRRRKDGTGYRMYRDAAANYQRECLQRPRSGRADELEALTVDVLTQLQVRLPQDWQTRIVTMASEQRSIASQAQEQQTAMLQTRLERAKRLFVMGELSEDEYTAMRDEINAQMPTQQPRLITPTANTSALAAVLTDLPALLKHATLDELQSIYKLLFDRMYMGGGTITAVQPTSLLWSLVQPQLKSPQESPYFVVRTE
jgi:site-specific DNA recombinase